jgi:hypothetical protein
MRTRFNSIKKKVGEHYLEDELRQFLSLLQHYKQGIESFYVHAYQASIISVGSGCAKR